MRVLILSLCLLFLCGCEDIQKDMKHNQSSWLGLNRTVTLYATSGEVIKVWKGKFKVEIEGSVASFITDTDKEIKILGTYIIEED